MGYSTSADGFSRLPKRQPSFRRIAANRGSPANVREQIGRRLFLFGAKPGRRKYPRDPGYGDQPGTEFQELAPVMAAQGAAGGPPAAGKSKTNPIEPIEDKAFVVIDMHEI